MLGAQALQFAANRVIKAWLGHPGALKVMMRWQGVPIGNPRAPLESLPAEREAALAADLLAAGYTYPVAETQVAG